MKLSPIVAAVRAALPLSVIAHERDHARRSPANRIDAVLANMETVARHARAQRGIVELDDFRRAGLSVNGLVEEPSVAGMTPAFTSREIETFAQPICDALQKEADAEAAKRERSERLRDRVLERAAQFVLGLFGGASMLAAAAHLAGLA